MKPSIASVVREIDRGSFGRVEEVELSDGNRMARKVFSPPSFSGTTHEHEKMLTRFRREVRVQSSLDSTRIVPIAHHELDGQTPWYLMPVAERNFLQEIEASKRSGVVPQKALLDILNALEELHEMAYVHRDLKPANILLIDGVWKLGDFGLVLPPNGATTKLTSMDSNWGTVQYCAPEQAVEFRNATYLVDIYAFGCILHDIYGDDQRVPYGRCTAPGEMGDIIEKCTETSPAKRFQSIKALRGALLTVLDTSPQIAVSKAAAEWIDALATPTDLDVTVVGQFVRYLVKEADRADKYAVLRVLGRDVLERIRDVDTDLFKTVCLVYCEWAETSAFGWEFCDTVIVQLEGMFAMGDLETKAAAILAAAELGRSHNRWHVMGRVVDLCGPNMDDLVARRVAIEIRAREVANNFARCAEGISRQTHEYHPRILQVIKDTLS